MGEAKQEAERPGISGTAHAVIDQSSGPQDPDCPVLISPFTVSSLETRWHKLGLPKGSFQQDTRFFFSL